MRQVYLAVCMNIFHSIYVVYLGYPFGWFFALLFIYLYYRINIVGKQF